MRRALTVTSRSPDETRILGASLAPVLLPGDVVSLSGDLGAGKTVFVQGIATALGVEKRVTSPSFTIVHEYQGRFPIVHVDVYRLDSFQEVLDLGFEELLDPGAILLVEWGEAVAPLLGPRYLEIDMRRSLDPVAENDRDLAFRPRGLEWEHKLESLRKTAETLLDAASADGPGGERFSYAPVRPARDHRESAGGFDLEG
jgi:tRNA threonylcarbamoyladenosine biosynthesis protein TsaE